MAYCPECGKQVGQAQKFCKECGYNLKAEESSCVEGTAETEHQMTTNCAEHPQRDSIGKCAGCGKEICDLCLTTTTDKIEASHNVDLATLTILTEKLYCPSCTDKIIQGCSQKTPKSVPYKGETSEQRLSWFKRHLNMAIFLAGIIPVAVSVLGGYLIHVYQLEWSYLPRIIIWIFLLMLSISCLAIMFWSCKQKGRSLWWGLFITIPSICFWVLATIGNDQVEIAAYIIPVGWIILMLLPNRRTPRLSRILTEEQMNLGLYLERDGDFLNLKRGDEFLTAFLSKVTDINSIREEAQKFIKGFQEDQVTETSIQEMTDSVNTGDQTQFDDKSRKRKLNWFREHAIITVILIWFMSFLIAIGIASAFQPRLSAGPGCYLEYQADFTSIPQQNQGEYLQNTMQIMKERLIQIAPQFQIIRIGDDRISVYVPDASDLELIDLLLGRTMEFIICEQANSINTSVLAAVNTNDRIVTVEDVTGFGIGDIFSIGSGSKTEMQIIARIDKGSNTLYVRQGFAYSHYSGEIVTNQWTPAIGLIDDEEKALTGKYLLPNSYVSLDQTTSEPIVQFEWNNDGAMLFSQITGRLIGEHLAIFLDNSLLSVSTVQAQISARGIIEGMSQNEAQVLSTLLNIGAPPLDLIQLDANLYLLRSGKPVTQSGSALYCTFALSDAPGDTTEDKLEYICETVANHFKVQKNIEPCIYVMKTEYVVNVGDKASMMIYLPIQLADDGISIMSMLSLSHDIIETNDYTIFDTQP